jgi:hypothetical protein
MAELGKKARRAGVMTGRATVKWLAVAALGGACLGFALTEMLIAHELSFQAGKYAAAGTILTAIVTYKLSRQGAARDHAD